MSNTSKWTVLALSALMLCSACGQTTKTATLITPTAQVVTLKWDEAVAATTTAKVSNGNLISMR